MVEVVEVLVLEELIDALLIELVVDGALLVEVVTAVALLDTTFFAATVTELVADVELLLLETADPFALILPMYPASSSRIVGLIL